MIGPDPYATHQPLLMLAVANTKGPILELGAGHYSTPLLHAFSRYRGLITLDSDADWLERFSPLDDNHRHTLLLVRDWTEDLKRHFTERTPSVERIALCFVDQSPAEARGPSIEILRPIVDVFVCHDTQTKDVDHTAECDPNGYVILDTFQYRLDDTRNPRTSIVSDTIDIRAWL